MEGDQEERVAQAFARIADAFQLPGHEASDHEAVVAALEQRVQRLEAEQQGDASVPAPSDVAASNKEDRQEEGGGSSNGSSGRGSTRSSSSKGSSKGSSRRGSGGSTHADEGTALPAEAVVQVKEDGGATQAAEREQAPDVNKADGVKGLLTKKETPQDESTAKGQTATGSTSNPSQCCCMLL